MDLAKEAAKVKFPYNRTMCGRFTMAMDAEGIQMALQLGQMPADWRRRYNIAPSQPIPCVTDPKLRNVVMLRWGLVPSWAKEASIGYKMINARSETAQEKPSFRQAFKQRRCLILADGFYEWDKLSGRAKRPYYFTLRGGAPFAFAGLWESWQPREGPRDQAPLLTATILTTQANSLVGQYHERMPVMLSGDKLWDWLLETDPAALQALLRPYPAEEMQAWEVSNQVNRPAEDEPSLIRKSETLFPADE